MFKFVVVLAFVAVAVAQHSSQHHGGQDSHDHDSHGSHEDAHAEIKSLHSDANEHGFHYDFETSNHIRASADGDEHGNIHGDFEWVAPKGEHIDVKYVADEYGYHPKTDVKYH